MPAQQQDELIQHQISGLSDEFWQRMAQKIPIPLPTVRPLIRISEDSQDTDNKSEENPEPEAVLANMLQLREN